MKLNDYKRIFDYDLLKGAKFSGEYEFPVIFRTHSEPEKLVPFNRINNEKIDDKWVHFFLHDSSFKKLFNNPFRYLPQLKRAEGSLSPDCSIFWNVPLYKQINMTGQSRMIGSWLQRCGVDVIPTVRWGLEETYKFAFSAIEPGGTIAVGTHGVVKEKEKREVFTKGLIELLRRLAPKIIVVYGPVRDEIFEQVRLRDIKVIQFDPRIKEVFKRCNHG